MMWSIEMSDGDCMAPGSFHVKNIYRCGSACIAYSVYSIDGYRIVIESNSYTLPACQIVISVSRPNRANEKDSTWCCKINKIQKWNGKKITLSNVWAVDAPPYRNRRWSYELHRTDLPVRARFNISQECNVALYFPFLFNLLWTFYLIIM